MCADEMDFVQDKSEVPRLDVRIYKNPGVPRVTRRAFFGCLVGKAIFGGQNK